MVAIRRAIVAQALVNEGIAAAVVSDEAGRGTDAGYLPAQRGDEELARIVAEVVTETGAAGMSSMGQVMKAVTPRVAGRAEGARVAAEVRRRLTAGPF